MPRPLLTAFALLCLLSGCGQTIVATVKPFCEATEEEISISRCDVLTSGTAQGIEKSNVGRRSLCGAPAPKAKEKPPADCPADRLKAKDAGKPTALHERSQTKPGTASRSPGPSDLEAVHVLSSNLKSPSRGS